MVASQDNNMIAEPILEISRQVDNGDLGELKF